LVHGATLVLICKGSIAVAVPS
jgi:hypothetical protein